MALSNDEYSAPSLPFPGLHESSLTEENSFYHQDSLKTRRNSFMLDFETWTFLNHGAFGAALKPGYDRAAQWRQYLEEQPLRYFDRDLLPHLAHSARCLANFLSAPAPSTTAILPNVTSGLNAVLAGHSREYGSTAHCVLWDTSYGSVKKMIHHYYHMKGNSSTEIPLQAQYLDRLATAANPETVFQEALDDCLPQMMSHLQNKHICLVLDQTTSNTALTMPVAKLASQMKERYPNSLVVVDGAHGLLAQDTNLSHMFAAGVDIYLTNGHKWLSAPRGIGFLAVAANRNDLIQSVLRLPAVVSHGVDEPDLLSRFVWNGCRDYAAALSIPAVLDFWTNCNPEMVRLHCKNVLRQGIQILAAAWHHSRDVSSWPGNVTLVDFESSILSPMALVSLPTRLPTHDPATSTDAKKVQDYLYSQRIEVPIKCINGKLYVRVSCHIYNQRNDFEHLATAIQQMPLTL